LIIFGELSTVSDEGGHFYARISSLAFPVTTDKASLSLLYTSLLWGMPLMISWGSVESLEKTVMTPQLSQQQFDLN